MTELYFTIALTVVFLVVLIALALMSLGGVLAEDGEEAGIVDTRPSLPRDEHGNLERKGGSE